MVWLWNLQKQNEKIKTKNIHFDEYQLSNQVDDFEMDHLMYVDYPDLLMNN